MPWSLPRRRGDGGGHVQSQHIVKNRILRQLSADELKSVQPWLTPVELRSNVVLREPGDAIEQVYCVASAFWNSCTVEIVAAPVRVRDSARSCVPPTPDAH